MPGMPEKNIEKLWARVRWSGLFTYTCAHVSHKSINSDLWNELGVRRFIRGRLRTLLCSLGRGSTKARLLAGPRSRLCRHANPPQRVIKIYSVFDHFIHITLHTHARTARHAHTRRYHSKTLSYVTVKSYLLEFPGFLCLNEYIRPSKPLYTSERPPSPLRSRFIFDVGNVACSA